MAEGVSLALFHPNTFEANHSKLQGTLLAIDTSRK